MHEQSIFHTICPPQCIQLVESHSEHLADCAPASSQLRWPAGLEKPLAAGESVPLNGRNPSSSCFADGNLLKWIWDHDWVVKSNGLNTGTCGRLGVTVATGLESAEFLDLTQAPHLSPTRAWTRRQTPPQQPARRRR